MGGSPSPSKVYLKLGFHANFYHSWWGDEQPAALQDGVEAFFYPTNGYELRWHQAMAGHVILETLGE